jgi:hypothetical protein
MSAKERACRRCGCTYYTPCTDVNHLTCCWVERDLCSACLTPAERKRAKAGDRNPSQGRK